MASLRVSLEGLFANVTADLPEDCQEYWRSNLNEVLRHLRETIAGEHTLTEFAEFYCLTPREKAKAP